MVKSAGLTPALPSPATFQRWGVDPNWSRQITVPSHDGSSYEWHLLERSPAEPMGTIVCIHGNPTWSYLWRSLLAQLGDRYRVIAVDQLGMGYSQRTEPRRYATRVKDVSDVLAALDVTGPVILAAHDWGGAIAMGWAVAHRNRVQAMVLTNTGIAVPARTRGPALIRFAASTGITDFTCRRTPIFVGGTALLSGRRMTAIARRAYVAPYRGAASRNAIKSFVEDVPFSSTHPSFEALAAVAGQLGDLDIPVLLAWGGQDPVFSDAFADDLAGRFRHVDRHRFAKAGHLVVEEVDVANVVDGWLSQRSASPSLHPVEANAGRRALWAEIEAKKDSQAVAFLDEATQRTESWSDLNRRVMAIAAGLRATGFAPGERVALLIPPGPDLVAVLYGCWRAGLVTVIADKGLGLRGLGRAIRSAGPRWIIGPAQAVTAAKTLRWSPGALAVQTGGRAIPGTSVIATLDEVIALGSAMSPPAPPLEHDLAAILFTSGATGPAKGVRYTHAQLEAQRDALTATYGITAEDRLVAAFAPFALYGPALGIPSAIPNVDVTQPGTLTASAFDSACRSIDATIAFASPASLSNIAATATNSLPAAAKLRLILSAGAPVAPSILTRISALCPVAELHTPYGMTEALPIADIDLATILRIGPGHGVNVGHPVPGAQVRIDPITGSTGRILVSAPWVSDGYDRLWQTEANARSREGGREWHDSGDVGHLDDHGFLWIEGRGVHLIHATSGDITPVPIEIAAERVPGVERAAAVGVGPVGVQQLVIVIEGSNDGLASAEVAAAVRAAVAEPVAAVLSLSHLPVDIRHNAKIDRTAIARWATAVLDGKRAKPPT